MARISRRGFLGRGAATAGGAALAMSGGVLTAAAARPRRAAGFGELVPDPGGLLDLPPGFQYRVVSEEGRPMSNGAPTPGDFDGMAAYPGPDNTTVLVRNHELRPGDANPVPGTNPYAADQPGGTTGVVVGPDRRELSSFVTSSGSRNNCAGGATPWGTWITCEEDRTTNHGYCFEVDPRDPENDLSKTPIRQMGFFSHEAVDIDPRTGIVYLTEDDFRGRIDPNDPANDTRSSFLYRYVPDNRSQRPGALLDGGRLQALALEELPPGYDTDFLSPSQRFGVVWKDVPAEEPHDAALAQGCARFNRLEGCHFVGGAFWFDDTAGGEERLGQVYRYIPGTETLELFFEGTEANEMESPDNLLVTPWGDLWFAEDGDGENRLMGITPEGEVYKFASNRLNDSELCGPCFSPDGRTAFLNVQDPGITYAIWGPFGRGRGGRDEDGGQDAARQRRMAVAAPPRALAPRISPELAEAADRHGMTRLEAAAFDRLGVPLA